MRISIFVLCGLFFAVTSLSAQTHPVTTLSNAELFSRQYAQADTAETTNKMPDIALKDENAKKGKEALPKGAIPKTMLSGAIYETIGIFAGVGIGSLVGLIYSDPTGTQSNTDGMAEGLTTLAFGGIGAGVGAVAGCSFGTYYKGKRYKKGSYWHALAGTILPSLAVAGVTALVSDKNKYNFDATLVTFALAPITSTAAYYIFSEDLPDTLKINR